MSTDETERELYAAVVARRHEDAPRLAYADYIEDNDPARAEYIRLAIEEVHIEKDPQVDVDGSEAFKRSLEVFTRVRRLFWDHGGRWLNESGVKQYDPRPRSQNNRGSDARFNRGFIEHLAIPGPEYVEKAAEIHAAFPIRSVTFAPYGAITHELATSPYSEHLIHLGIYGSVEFADADIEILANSPCLKNVRIVHSSYNQLTRACLDIVAESQYWRELDLFNAWGEAHEEIKEWTGHYDYWPSGKDGIPPLGQELEKKHGPLKWVRIHSWPGRSSRRTVY